MKPRVKPLTKWSLIILILINLAMVIVGSLAFGKCPVEPYIPFYLVALGAVGLTGRCNTYFKVWLKGDGVWDPVTSIEKSLYTVEVMLYVFGSFWVYKEFPPSYDPNDGERYCQATAYWFAFISTTVMHVLLLVAVAVITYFWVFLNAFVLMYSIHGT